MVPIYYTIVLRTRSMNAIANKQFIPLRDTITFTIGEDNLVISVPLHTCPLPDDEDELEFAIDLGTDENNQSNDTVVVHILR